ncbi:MAG: cation:proton antiporter [Candidatus Levybacteria bacterium]|nr:cation:proton antiporter [Candidatus Levybacteria bacterium]
MTESFLRDIIFIATAAFFGGFLARSVKLPPVLGYISSGILFSLIGRPFISSYDGLLALSQLGISLLLFTHGFEITIDALKKIDKRILVVGVLQVIVTSFVLFPILTYFGLSISVAILFSILFSFSSTTIVIKILEEKGMLYNFPGSAIFLLLLVQDLFVIPVIILFPILFGEATGSVSSILGSLLVSAVKPIIIFLFILIFNKYFLSKVLGFIFRYPSHELTILATIFTAAITIALLKYAGLPDAIAAFLAGVIISEQGRNLAPLSEIRPLRDIFLVIFFVLTGMLFSVPYFIANFWMIIFLTGIVLFIKFIVIYSLLRIQFFNFSPSLKISSYIINVGEFAIVIGQLALLDHHISNDSYFLLLSVFILSLAFIPFENTIIEKIHTKINKYKFLKRLFPDSHGAVVHSEQKVVNHVIICGHGRVGRNIRTVLDVAEIPYIVIDYNRKAILDIQNVGKHALFGDPTDPDILGLAHVKSAKAMVITFSDVTENKKIIKVAKYMNKNLYIISRIHRKEDESEFLKLGADEVTFPESEAGLRLGVQLLKNFHISKDKQEEYIKRIHEV